MTRKVITVGVGGQVGEALRLMIKFDGGSVIVTDKQKPIGMITERDITRAALRSDGLLTLPVRSLMSTPIKSVPPDMEVWKAFEMMLKLEVRRLPIVQGSSLVGVIADKDLIRWVLRVFYEDALIQNPEIEALVGKRRCPNCKSFEDECTCARTAGAAEE